MNDGISTWASIFLRLVGVALGTWGIYLLIDADPRVQLGVLTVIGSVGGVVYAQHVTSRRERDSRLFQNKAQAYEEFFELIGEIAKGVISDSPISHDYMLEKSMAIQKGFMVWGSPETINTWIEFKDASENPSDYRDVLKKLDGVLQSARKDLGHDDGQKDEGWLIKMLLNKEAREMMNDPTDS